MAFQGRKMQLWPAVAAGQSKSKIGSKANIAANNSTLLAQHHIVDQLIKERGGKISNSIFWPIFRPLFYRFLHYKEAVHMADQVVDLSGVEAMDFVSEHLQLDIKVEGIENIPKSGGFVMVCNHPTGIADGVALWDIFKKVRQDMAVFANRDAVRVNRNLPEVIIPVEWREGHKSRDKSRETLQLTNKAIAENRPIVLFPSGRIAYWADGGLNEREWQTSALALARKYNLPILPANMKSRNSGLFYWFAKWSSELRDMTVFHEFLNKQGSEFQVTFGDMIDIESLGGDLAEVTMRLQNFCTCDLADDPKAKFSAG